MFLSRIRTVLSTLDRFGRGTRYVTLFFSLNCAVGDSRRRVYPIGVPGLVPEKYTKLVVGVPAKLELGWDRVLRHLARHERGKLILRWILVSSCCWENSFWASYLPQWLRRGSLEYQCTLYSSWRTGQLGLGSVCLVFIQLPV